MSAAAASRRACAPSGPATVDGSTWAGAVAGLTESGRAGGVAAAVLRLVVAAHRRGIARARVGEAKRGRASSRARSRSGQALRARGTRHARHTRLHRPCAARPALEEEAVGAGLEEVGQRQRVAAGGGLSRNVRHAAGGRCSVAAAEIQQACDEGAAARRSHDLEAVHSRLQARSALGVAHGRGRQAEALRGHGEGGTAR